MKIYSTRQQAHDAIPYLTLRFLLTGRPVPRFQITALPNGFALRLVTFSNAYIY